MRSFPRACAPAPAPSSWSRRPRSPARRLSASRTCCCRWARSPRPPARTSTARGCGRATAGRRRRWGRRGRAGRCCGYSATCSVSRASTTSPPRMSCVRCAVRLGVSVRHGRRAAFTRRRTAHVLETLATTWLSLPDYARSTVWTLVITVGLIICVALLTLWERKVIGWMQLRRGPNRVRLFGLLPGVGQPFADVFKLLMKEVVVPAKSNGFLFRLAPLIALVPALADWAVIPLSPTVVVSKADAGLLYLLSLTSMGVYGVIVAGWAANSKYAFLGAMRSAP